MNRARSLVLAALALALAAGAAALRSEEAAPAAEGPSMPTGLRFRLSDAAGDGPAAVRPAPPAPAEPLSPEATKALLDRLPPIGTEGDDAKEHALREGSAPPPLAGKKVVEPFPPPGRPEPPPAAAAGPLEVVRFAPEGRVPLAPHASVTFSQPMVAVTGVSDLAVEAAPAKLTPEPDGEWRWVGTKTLLFQPKTRFPMATRYAFEVPAGTTSATGGRLEHAFRFHFETPPPQLVSKHPVGGPQGLEPVIFLGFDQRIDPAAVLPFVEVSVGGKLRLATVDEVERDPEVARLAKAAEPGRWMALRLDKRLSPGATVTVALGRGAPSAEGPLTTEEAQTFEFRTYERLRVEDHGCSWGKKCPPLTPWFIRFNNPIDEKAFAEAGGARSIKVAPDLPGLEVDVSGSHMTLRGASRGRTTYAVTVPPTLRDTFGQTLEREETLAFHVGSAEPVLGASGNGFVVLDPYGSPRFSVYSMNHRKLEVTIHAVTPSDFPAFAKLMRENDPDDLPAPPGREVFADTIEPKGEPDTIVETVLDLAPALGNGLGHAVVIVRPAERPKEHWRWQMVRAWVQSTRIGLDAAVDASEMVAWATSLKDGAPLEGVEVTIEPGGAVATTATDGTASLALPEQNEDWEAPRFLLARAGADAAILPERLYWWGGSTAWRRRDEPDALRWYVLDDRKMYRPGEVVCLKGWIRRVGGGEGGDVGPLERAAAAVEWTAVDSRNSEIGKGEVALGALGGFDFKIEIPKQANLGHARVHLRAAGGTGGLAGGEYHHTFQVQEFRRPEFEVSTSASEGPHLVGGHAVVSVRAAYYAGGGLPDAEATWTVRVEPGSFTPPGRGDFTFGTWVPWWTAWHDERGGESSAQTHVGRTDALGVHRLRIDFDGVRPPRPAAVRAEATVMDVNRQAWTSGVDLLVHPAEHYVGLRAPRTFVEGGQPIVVEAIVTDLEGRTIPGRAVALRAARIAWRWKGGAAREEERAVEERRITSAEGPVRATFEGGEGGMYRIAARIEDERGRPNESEITVWVAGGAEPPRRAGVGEEDVTLIPDRKEYRGGDTAEILVQAPFTPAEGLVTLRRSGIVARERFRMTEPTYTLRVPIDDAYVPNVTVQVDLVGAAGRVDEGTGEVDPKLPKRPAIASGTLDLRVPPVERALAVTVAARKRALEPGGETVIDVTLRDAAGKPVGDGEVAVVVVDEAILALTGYAIADPIAVFYSDREPGAADHHLRPSVLLATPDDLLKLAQATGGGPRGGGRLMKAEAMEEMARDEITPPAPTTAAAPGGEPGGAPIRARTRFDALAAFAPSLRTDAHGHAEVVVKMPDSLTRYRITAVAVEGGKRFGSGESTVTVRLPLMVRPSAPRFLNFGDRFELPVVVQNQTDEPLAVDVVARAANAAISSENAGRRVRVPANDRVEVRFPAAAARAGTARFQVGAASGVFADAAEVKLPVFTPATSEAFATYGEIDDAAPVVQPVRAPAGAIPSFGGLEVTTSSTALQALTDAVVYLVQYPFECAEQISSRVLAIAALRDVLAAFEAEGLPPENELVAAVGRDVKRLEAMQNGDGGFGFWRRGSESWPYVSLHASHALARAKQKGFDVPEHTLDRAKKYLAAIEKHIPTDYSEDVKRSLIAYSFYVRAKMGDPDPGGARAFLGRAGIETLPLEALGWTLAALEGERGWFGRRPGEVADILKHLGNRVEETADAAHFATSYGDGSYLLLHSDRRADAIILEALIGIDPKSDLIPKIVRGLLAHRKKGRWGNTQENAFVLLALDRYFATYEKETPDFLARVWLGDRFAGEHAFKGRTTARSHIEVPMPLVAGGGAAAKDLVIQKDGSGRLYYRVGLRYAPQDLALGPLDRGFVVAREYEAVDAGADVRRDPDGTWRVKAGARVRVRVTMVAPARRYHVALVDPLPAGLEPLNPELRTTGGLPPDPGRGGRAGAGAARRGERPAFWWWWGPWYEHQNLRDERAEAFASLLWEGVHELTYLARATTPGSFVVPPPRAEEMYAPETFGRGGTDRLIVE